MSSTSSQRLREAAKYLERANALYRKGKTWRDKARKILAETIERLDK